jgi:hypothetical protein
MHAAQQGSYPDGWFTKAEVIDYYVRLAPFIRALKGSAGHA